MNRRECLATLACLPLASIPFAGLPEGASRFVRLDENMMQFQLWAQGQWHDWFTCGISLTDDEHMRGYRLGKIYNVMDRDVVRTFLDNRGLA